MMLNNRGPSISRKLMWMNMLVSGVALLTACAAFIGYDVLTFRTTELRNLSVRAQIVGSNCVSALLFDDPDSAQKTLSALQADPAVVAGVSYTPEGRPCAWVSRQPNYRSPSLVLIPHGKNEVHWIANDEIVLEHSIVSDGQLAGSVYLCANAEALAHRLRLYAGISFLVLLASLLAALLVSYLFRRSVARPIVRLAEIARIISREKGFSLRVPQVRGPGEISVLIDAFNEMMAQIELSEESLRRAHDELELRVQERTAELVAAQKKMESYSQSILRAKEDIERASKFKDQFLSTMSHELRTPLNAVLGFSELLSDTRYGPLNERQQRYVNHIRTSGQHLLELINDILDLSKIEAGRLQLTFEDVPVQLAFAEVCGTLQPLAGKKSQTLVGSASPELVVRADGTRFRQMLMNLLGNAIKFTPQDGKIELSARQLGDFVQIEVRDSGPGIPIEDQQRIFDAFHRLKQSGQAAEGTGLGLAITRSLVQLHGGHLGLDSKPGSGSCFYFTLPTAAEPQKNEDRKLPSDDNPRPAAKVLVIEDDPAAADLLESQLTSAGYEVIVCGQPQQALEMAAALRPAAITLDIVMLPVNGWDILSSFKSDPRTVKIPVVVVSVMDQRATGALLGADEYIVKPVDRAVLLAAMERCLSGNGKVEKEQNILVVEDDDATREFISDLLVGKGYGVRTAADGAQARAQVRQSLPMLVILDLILPEVGGLQLIAEWRAEPRTAALPVFVLTNKDLALDEKEYLRANTAAFFSKQERWLDALIRQIRSAVPPALTGES